MTCFAHSSQLRDLQGFLEPEVEDVEENTAEDDSSCRDITLDTARSLTLDDVFGSLPPRSICDDLADTYFNGPMAPTRESRAHL